MLQANYKILLTIISVKNKRLSKKFNNILVIFGNFGSSFVALVKVTNHWTVSCQASPILSECCSPDTL